MQSQRYLIQALVCAVVKLRRPLLKSQSLTYLVLNGLYCAPIILRSYLWARLCPRTQLRNAETMAVWRKAIDAEHRALQDYRHVLFTRWAFNVASIQLSTLANQVNSQPQV